MSLSLSERITMCCPCRTGKSCSTTCRCKPAVANVMDCDWPGHALGAEVGELERDKMGAEYDAGLERARADDAKKRAWAAEYRAERDRADAIRWGRKAVDAEALLAEAPDLPMVNPMSWLHGYGDWLARVRAAGRKG